MMHMLLQSMRESGDSDSAQAIAEMGHAEMHNEAK